MHREGNSDAVNGQKGKLDAALLGADFHVGDLRVSADFGSQDHRLTAVTPSITIAGDIAIPRAPDASRQIAQPWTYSNERDTFGTLRAEYDIDANLTAWLAGGFRDGHEANNLTTVNVGDALGTDSVVGFSERPQGLGQDGRGRPARTFSTGPVKHTVVGSAGVPVGLEECVRVLELRRRGCRHARTTPGKWPCRTRRFVAGNAARR